MLERNTRLLGTLVLALALAVTAAQPGAAAVGSHKKTAAEAPGSGLFESFRAWLSAWWTGQDAGGRGLSSLWGAMGPEMDPDGKTTTTAAPVPTVGTTTDMGPEMDPNGK